MIPILGHFFDNNRGTTIGVTVSNTGKRVWLFCLGLLLGLQVYAQPAEDDFGVIRSRLTETLLNSTVNAEEVTRIMTTMASDGTWPAINYRDTSRTGFEHHVHLANLLTMAKAYRQAGSPYTDNAQLLKVFKTALHHWLLKDYRCENWWWNEIGTPDAMADILLLMGGELDDDELAQGLAIAARSNFDTFGARPGGDFIKMAAIKAVTELVRQDTAAFANAIKTMADQIYITEDRGIKPDMSFHHRTDGVPSTLSYGRGYANAFAYWADVVRGTQFAFEPRATELVIDYYLDGMRKAMPFGRFDDPGIKNRDVSRKRTSGAYSRDYTARLLTHVSDYRRNELEHPNLRSNQYFWFSHYHSHQRPHYFASVRMYSNRSNNIEAPYNEEGLKNHFYADGSQFISRTGREYFNIYPSWDWRKIPGTTTVQVDTFPRWQDMVKKGTTAFVGGVSDGEYGATTFDLLSPHSGLRAHKSWFFFDDEIVCLGAGITSTMPQPVMTTLNQSLLYGPVWVNDVQETGGRAQQIEGPVWINHDSIGYVIPDASRIWVRQGESTGTWRSITHQASANDEPITQNIFTLTIDHGMRPKDAGYAYIVLPAKDAAATKAYAQKLPVEIVSNTTALQAVSNMQLGVDYAVFYEPGDVVFPNGVRLITNEPGLFMVKSGENGMRHITIADPTRKLENIVLRLELPAGRGTTVTVPLPQGALAGKSLQLEVVL
ncbi:polysaccharide lyase family 8 super-sandwich domain-containing protein [Parapedobacter soli]|uniref:polysaccharide lyase family 8 super-sandwich domain-containing protein n=1 Tax=Parapedobacter soli TaxID=416955 RepID=UPI0021C5B707|nr:polysaccharide lyase family 8 super-sandwich domain-containing protein [Parapedobacter soli]